MMVLKDTINWCITLEEEGTRIKITHSDLLLPFAIWAFKSDSRISSG